MSIKEDYYKILFLTKNATDKDIKKAYRKLARKWHPDKNLNNKKEAENKFKIISEAYSILSDPEKKKHYDMFGHHEQGMPRNGNGFSSNMSPHMTQHIFSQFFSGGNNSNSSFFMSSNNSVPVYDSPFRRSKSFLKKNNFNIINNGSLVKIINIQNELYKNKHGIISGYNEQNKQYIVKIDQSIIMISRNNLQQIVKCQIINLEGKPELNDTKATIVGYNNVTSRFLIQIRTGIISLKSKNLIIQNNTNVKLINLNNISMNNQFGNIVNFNKLKGRYTIRLNNHKIVSIKPENIII